MRRGDLAIQYAARGWAVFPVKLMQKRPQTLHGFEAGTCDLVTVRRWWRTTDWNIGIWTGESNLIVIDLDVKPEKGDAGISWWLPICEAAGFDPDSTYNATTPTGGMHAYFESENLYPPRVDFPTINVDIRAGLSYVVAAGSETDVGVYEHHGADQPAKEPDWLHALLEPQVRKRYTSLEQQSRDTVDGFLSAVEGICRVFRESLQGERNNTLNWAVWKVGQHWWTNSQQEEALERLRMIAVEIGVDDDKPGQTDDTIKSARRKWPQR